MRTVAQWKVIQKELRRQYYNAEARANRAYDRYKEAEHKLQDKCSKCGVRDWSQTHTLQKTHPSYIKFQDEKTVVGELNSQIWQIEDWIETLETYNEGEPDSD